MMRPLSGVPTFDPKAAQHYEEDPLFVRAVGRAVAVLACFEHSEQPLTLSEIAQLAGIDRSAAQRMVHSLQALGLIERDEDDRGYRPGKQILAMACSSLRLNPVVKHANPILLELRRRTNERVDMSFWDDTRLIYALRMPSRHEIFTATLTGNTVPVYCTAGGLAVMAWLGDDEISDIVARSDMTPFTPDTYRNLDQVMTGVTRARDCGHAIALRQLVRHEITLGVAITDKNRRPIGAIHLGANLADHSPEALVEAYGDLLIAAGRSISAHA